jgi:uncharacterized protein (TIGR03086 family)
MTQQPAGPTATDDLEEVLAATVAVVEGIGAQDWGRPTPCRDFDVAALVDHVLTWSSTYADRVSASPSQVPEAGPAATADRSAARAGAALASCAERIVGGYRADTDGSRDLPVGLLLLDYVGHAWDLAVATGQSLRVPDSAVERALGTGRAMLTAENRGDLFGPPSPVDDDATGLERLVAFLGRDPAWTA